MIERRPRGLAVLDGVTAQADALVLPWYDPAVQWGLGVFETVAVRGGAPRHLAEHLDRLDASAERLLVKPPDAQSLTIAVTRVAAGVEGGTGWLKIVVSRSGRYAVFGAPEPAPAELEAVSAVVLPWRRHRTDPTLGVKSLAYAAAIRGLEEAQRRGADDGIWLNERGHAISACTANLFVVRRHAVSTPAPADGARPGVARGRAIAALRAAGWRVSEGKVRVLALRRADEIVATSSLAGVRAIVRLDGRDVGGGTAGPVARMLYRMLDGEDAVRDLVAGGSDPGGGIG